MKLKNKLSGEIKEFTLFDGNELQGGVTLESLSEEWEDYEEPEVFYIVEHNGGAGSRYSVGGEYEKKFKQIGNYFETREEAELAVRKLKAWKRLRDKGFRFTAWYGGSKNISYEITSLENETYIPRQICDDLDLLFSQEDD